MPKQKANLPPAVKVKRLAHAAKPWDTTLKPDGLHVVRYGISTETANAVWEFFHPSTEDFPWIQRFGKQYPKTAHYNWWSTGAFVGDVEQAEFKAKYPAIYAMVQEAIASMKAHVATVDPGSLFENFKGEAVNVHLHKPNWGLGAHYDDAHNRGKGMVLMVSIGNEHQFPKPTRKARTFRFTEPIMGHQCDVETKCRQVLLFMDDAYDLWRHESVRNPKQTGDNLSFTIRLRSVCGQYGTEDDRTYRKGPREAESVAHLRMREDLGLGPFEDP